MLILISPAKTLDFSPRTPLVGSKPRFMPQANKLAKQVRTLSSAKLARLMSISPKLAETTYGFYAAWKTKYNASSAKEAIFAFRGDVYLGLEALELSDSELEFAQEHLRILSGLYGVLRPLDLIQPYRLEMGTKLGGDHGKDLYAYWGDAIAKSLAKEARDKESSPVVVNLASQEYFAAVDRAPLKSRVITPSFRDLHKGEYKVISFFAKKARGMMARHLIESRAESPAELLKFRTAGYRYNAALSSEVVPVFTREKQN